MEKKSTHLSLIRIFGESHLSAHPVMFIQNFLSGVGLVGFCSLGRACRFLQSDSIEMAAATWECANGLSG